MNPTGIKGKLFRGHQNFLVIYSSLAAFGTYSCMYAFRKPFAVAQFDGMDFLHVDYKIWLITAQVLGYTLSKFLGIKIISELKQTERHLTILIFIGIAELALLLFAVVPKPYNIVFLFMNGLPLGMIWGIVFSYLEGKRNTEILGAGLCTSFIFSSGLVKSTGKWLMEDFGVSEFWMPFATGLIYTLPLILFVFMLKQVPEPDEKDQMARTKRVPMTGKGRAQIVKEFGWGLIFLIFSYLILTAFRDFRDNFAAEIWQALGHGSSAEVFTLTEIPTAIFVLIVMSLTVFIKNNLRALMINHLLVVLGFILAGGATLAFDQQMIGPFAWVTLTGLGLYLGYVPFNSIFFDRMIATFRSTGNVGFLIYLADSFGYLGSVGVLFYKNFAGAEVTWLTFFKSGLISMSLLGAIFMGISSFYFSQKHKKKSLNAPEPKPERILPERDVVSA